MTELVDWLSFGISIGALLISGIISIFSLRNSTKTYTSRFSPYIIVFQYMFEDGKPSPYLEVVNVGYGTAIDIKLDFTCENKSKFKEELAFLQSLIHNSL